MARSDLDTPATSATATARVVAGRSRATRDAHKTHQKQVGWKAPYAKQQARQAT